MSRPLFLAAVLAVSLGLAEDTFAKGPDKTKATEKALFALLAASNDTVTPGSSCDAPYGQQGPARVVDIVATALSVFHRGNNTIVGSCLGQDRQTCSLSISHAFGEEVSSAEFRFKTRNAKALADTLECATTP
jgi:hypothetical protein